MWECFFKYFYLFKNFFDGTAISLVDEKVFKHFYLFRNIFDGIDIYTDTFVLLSSHI